MNIKERFKRWFKLRFAILYPFSVFAVLFISPNEPSFKAGMWWIIIGLLIRLWANGYAIKLDKLTTLGPYAFIRHPLYLGTMLVIIGFVIMLKLAVPGVLFTALVAFIYYWTIKKEERQLEGKFGNLYINYKEKVPAIIPTIFPYCEGQKWPFSFKRLIQSQEYKLFFWVIIITLVFYFKEEFIEEQETMNIKRWSLMIGGFLLGFADLIGEFVKWRNKKWRQFKLGGE